MQTTQLIGSYKWLTMYPMFETITFLFMVSIVAVFYIRDVSEGLAYNTSRCALWGGLAVLCIIAMGIDAIRTGIIPPFLAGDTFHIGAAALSVVLAGVNIHVNLKKEDGVKETMADCYHNWILLPGYIYLIITLLPLIFAQAKVSGGLETLITIFVPLIAIAVWILTGFCDKSWGRLDQPKYLRSKGLMLPVRDQEDPYR